MFTCAYIFCTVSKEDLVRTIIIHQLIFFCSGFFAVFDGHGDEGHSCAWYARDTLPARLLESIGGKEENCEEIIKKAHVDTNMALHEDANINDAMSGTTAVSFVITPGRKITINNVGDSRAMIISEIDGTFTGKPLSNDQTPYRRDERERCKAAGARIRTMGQLDSPDPIDESEWDKINLLDEIDLEGDPPRVWLPKDRLPGCAFTRSIGDSVAERVGCYAEPEIDRIELTDKDRYLILASDGVFEFIKVSEITEMVSKLQDPLNACKAIAEDAYNRWMSYEGRSDDITIIILACGGVSTDAHGIDPSLITLSESLSNDNISSKARGRKSLAIGGL